MIIEIKKPYGKWIPGHKPDVLGQVAMELIQRGIAEPADDQTRQDLPPKKEEEKEQTITVNNYYVLPEQEEEPKKRKHRAKK